MDEKQRRLIDYFNRLHDPAPPPAAAAEETLTESVTPLAPIAPPRPTPASVRRMLEQRRDAWLEAASTEAVAGVGVEESVTARGVAPPDVGATPGRLLRRPAPVQLQITERTIEVAVAATERALNDEDLDEAQQDVLEAIVLPGKRPVLDVSDGDFSDPPPGWEFLDAYRDIVRAVLPAIGRIDVPELAAILPYAGTGFFVGENLLLTNRHVAAIFVEGVGLGERYLRFQAGRTASFDPQYEVGDPEPGQDGARFAVERALLVHPHWDAALLRVRPVGGAQMPAPLRLASEAPPNFGGGASPHIVVIGYPALDSRSDVAEQMNIFRQIFNRKRLMPGYLTGFGNVRTRWQARLDAATHDASTLGGNSGSAVIELTTGRVLALHFAGRYLVANYGVPTWELARDRRVTELGLNYDGPLPIRPTGPSGAPGAAGGTQSEPIWLTAWDGTVPLAADETAGGPVQPAEPPVATPVTPAAPQPEATAAPALPVGPDWFERVSDAELTQALHRDRAATERLIRETLLPEEADDLIADLLQGVASPDSETIEEGLFDFLTGRAKVDPTLPEIIFLHGIMGGHLAASGGLGGRVWLSPLAFAAGGVARRLALADDGERDHTPNQILSPDGHIRMVYEKAARKWRMGGFAVHAFAYDWRKPISHAADRLHFFIESLRLERPAKRFALVAHSMGGLVATLYAARHPEWSARVTQAIFLGAPLRGSYVPIEGLLGSYPVLAKAAFIDWRDGLDDFVQTVRTLPGLIDMLPDPEIFPDAAPLYERATWPERNAPAQLWLDQSRQLKQLLRTSPLLETARLIVSPDHPTVGMVGVANGRLQAGPRNRRGDGTVPTRSAAASVPGVTVYRAGFTHGDLPREPAVLRAVVQLLREGRSDLPVLSQREIEDTSVITEAVVEFIEEGPAIADLGMRARTGIFTQRDIDFLLRADHATAPGQVGAHVSR